MVFGPAEAFTPEQIGELYDINVVSTQRVNRAALPHLRRQGAACSSGSSSSARGGTPPFLAPYFAAKAAMDSLAVSYAAELARWGSRRRSSCRAPSHRARITSPMRANRPMRHSGRLRRARMPAAEQALKASPRSNRRTPMRAPSRQPLPTSSPPRLASARTACSSIRLRTAREEVFRVGDRFAARCSGTSASPTCSRPASAADPPCAGHAGAPQPGSRTEDRVGDCRRRLALRKVADTVQHLPRVAPQRTARARPSCPDDCRCPRRRAARASAAPAPARDSAAHRRRHRPACPVRIPIDAGTNAGRRRSSQACRTRRRPPQIAVAIPARRRPRVPHQAGKRAAIVATPARRAASP